MYIDIVVYSSTPTKKTPAHLRNPAMGEGGGGPSKIYLYKKNLKYVTREGVGSC